MVRKMLTAIDQVVSRTVINETQIQTHVQEWVSAHATAHATTIAITQKDTIRTLDVQRLMTTMRLLQIPRLMPIIPVEDALRRISELRPPTTEEQKAIRTRTLPYHKLEQIEIEKSQRLTPEQRKQETRRLELYRTAINLTEQTVLAWLEKWLWENFPLEVIQILGELLKQSIRKSWYADRLIGLEPLEKLMLQTYVYTFMEFPMSLNMLGLRVTPLTMFVLRHRPASIYMTYAVLKDDIMQKALSLSALLRKPELKGVLAGKVRREIIPRKENIGVTHDIDDDTKVSTGKDLMGKEWFFTALRYAYSMPYWMRRRLAREFGMPENHKFARYFGIGCIPTRYARKSWKYRYYPDVSFTNFRRDEYLKMMKKFEERHNIGVPYSGRYGGFKFKM